jgi:hypothetical protein
MIPTSSDQIRAKAAEFASTAADVTDEDERQRYLSMARYWLVLASEVVGANIAAAEATLVPAQLPSRYEISAE